MSFRCVSQNTIALLVHIDGEVAKFSVAPNLEASEPDFDNLVSVLYFLLSLCIFLSHSWLLLQGPRRWRVLLSGGPVELYNATKKTRKKIIENWTFICNKQPDFNYKWTEWGWIGQITPKPSLKNTTRGCLFNIQMHFILNICTL